MSRGAQITFLKYGRSYHMRIETAADLARAAELDDALWVSSGAPVRMIQCDPTFLEWVDSDNNGRILCHEIKQAICWLLATLGDHRGVTERSTVLPLTAVNGESDDGRKVLRAIEKMLRRLGEAEAGRITLRQVRTLKADAEKTPVSEAGVVLPQAADREEIRQFIADIVATVGGSPHPSGSQGVDEEHLEEFLRQAEAYLRWLAQGELPDGQVRSEIMPLGERTGEAYAVFARLRERIDQYFAQCEAVAFDPRVAAEIGPGLAELREVDFDDPKAIEAFMAAAPIAEPNPDRVLCLTGRQVNPYYHGALEELRVKALAPALGEEVERLSQQQWQRVKQFYAAHGQWLAGKAGRAVEPLGTETLRRYLEPRFPEAVRSLIAEKMQTAVELESIRLVEKLILYQANLIDLANNFVGFPYLYDAHRRAMFEMGRLVMDGRHFNFSVLVPNRAEHAAIVRTSNIFTMYVEISPPEGGTFEVAVPVTSGGKGNLCVGKRGIFRDVSGRELDARVVHIVENPISISEALLSPFQRAGRILTGKIESIAATAEKRLDTAVAATSDRLHPVGTPAPTGQATSRGLLAGGLLMGGGVALAALGSAFAYVTKSLAAVRWYQIVLMGAGLVLAVLLPISIVALMKLRRRDLSAILEGSGWAINARMRLTLRQGRFFTRRPGYPKGAIGLRRWGGIAR